MKYQVIDSQTKRVVRETTTLKAARRAADRLDLAYGAIRYSVQAFIPAVDRELTDIERAYLAGYAHGAKLC